MPSIAPNDPVEVPSNPTGHDSLSPSPELVSATALQHRDTILVYLLTVFAAHPTIIFTRTIPEVQRLSFLLNALGFAAIPLYGALPPSQQQEALSKFKSARRHALLIATDVACRDLDIPQAGVVINFEPPPDSESYVRRAARVTRCGRSVTLVTQYHAELFQRVQRAVGFEWEALEIGKEEALALEGDMRGAQRTASRLLSDWKEKGKRSKCPMAGGREEEKVSIKLPLRLRQDT
jgi:superfamily II DNA/RNA helicase